MSSMEPIEAPAAEEQSTTVSDPPAVSRKSYRRKYRKIMVTFEEKMRESNSLFKEEQRIMDVSQRLAEQTDQLLQLLLELNSCPQVPPSLRYDLSTPDESGMLEAEAGPFAPGADIHVELQKARRQIGTGQTKMAGYLDLEAALLKTTALAPRHSYSKLLQLAPPSKQTNEKADAENVSPCGFLSVRQEEQYLHGLDAYTIGNSVTPRPHATISLGSRNAEKTVERERETQLKNPVSVYNWLRRHQPQVFLQDNEASTEKTPRTTASRTSARKSVTKELLKQEPDLYDDDGIAKEHLGSARSKRKRGGDDDGGYRPKGGSSRSSKRRRDTKEDSGRNKRAKKSSIDIK